MVLGYNQLVNVRLFHTDGTENKEVKHETNENEYMHHEIFLQDDLEETSFKQIKAEIDQKFAELIEKKEDGLYRCTVCEKKIKNKKDMKRHLETHLSGLSYDCSLCGKNLRSSNALRRHIYNNH